MKICFDNFQVLWCGSVHAALVKVTNIQLITGNVTGPVLLDLRAAFDTVNHNTLIHRLKNWF